MRQHLKKYWPEVTASGLLILYTILRTLIVAHGISPVSGVSWQFFLLIELLTTVPYVWGMGVMIRRAHTRQPQSITALIVAVASLIAPYLYLAFYGALSTAQGIWVFVGLLVVFTLPSLIRFIGTLRHRS